MVDAMTGDKVVNHLAAYPNWVYVDVKPLGATPAHYSLTMSLAS
jgi:hypothetical protein